LSVLLVALNVWNTAAEHRARNAACHSLLAMACSTACSTALNTHCLHTKYVYSTAQRGWHA
jgi:hypothetical protein